MTSTKLGRPVGAITITSAVRPRNRNNRWWLAPTGGVVQVMRLNASSAFDSVPVASLRSIPDYRKENQPGLGRRIHDPVPDLEDQEPGQLSKEQYSYSTTSSPPPCLQQKLSAKLRGPIGQVTG